MSDNKVFDTLTFFKDNYFDYVKFTVDSWKTWIGKTMEEIEKVGSSEIKLLTCFSIIEMLSQEYMADLKKVYAAIDEQTALTELENFDDKWRGKYPKIAISWRDNWANLSTYLNIRKRSELSFTQQVPLRASTVSCVKLPRIKVYFQRTIAFSKCFILQ